MKVFYGYSRAPKDVPDDMDKVFIDDDTTRRQERSLMMECGLRPEEGDTLHLFALSDLGQGAEAKVIREALEAQGVAIKLVEAHKPPETRGRPAMFKPTPQQDEKCKTLYHSYLHMGHVLDRVEQIMGHRFEKHHLKARYGRRWKKQEEGQSDG